VTELEFHSWAVWVQFGLAALTFLSLLFLAAPYGRHTRAGWGPSLPAVAGWVLMEAPAVLLFALFFFTGDNRGELVPLLLLGMWQVHYLNRTLIFPFRMRATGRRMPVLIPLLALVFNALNAYINARWIGHLGSYGTEWLSDPRFGIGAALFFAGWFGNLHSDAILRRLRKPGETGYKIPRGGLYRWVSAPNYLCEILEWIGWAIATWSPAGLAFALYSMANLAPRALKHHAWYRERFEDYPSERRALIPYLL
jgi:protein-S-isoprenylcysteine O-methyltransferase Ste14